MVMPSRLVRAVLPPRVPASTRAFLATLMLAGIGAGAAATLLQPRPVAATAALPEPVHHWPYDGAMTEPMPASFTLFARVRWDGTSAPRSLVHAGEVQLATRGSTVEVLVRDHRGGVRLASSVPLVAGRWTPIAITRSVHGARLSLWVDGNETRVEHDRMVEPHAGFALPGGRAVRDVIVWDQPLSAAQLASVE